MSDNSHYLFPRFLDDPAEYEAAERFWTSQWGDLVSRIGAQDLWETPWLNTRFADATPCRDGNPIFSAWCPSRHLGIRVIQLEASGNPREIQFWTGTFAKGEPEAVSELVISCVLTRETLHQAMDMMSQWIQGEEIRVSGGTQGTGRFT